MESSLTPNIYLTEIYKDYDCDVFFKINEHLYSLVNVSEFKEEKGVFYRHKVYCPDGNVLYNDFKFWRNNEEYQYLNIQKKYYKKVKKMLIELVLELYRFLVSNLSMIFRILFLP